MKSQYVQYGCGLSSPDSWINFDASPNLWLERLPVLGRFYSGTKALEGGIVRLRFPENIRYGDIVKGLPIEPNSCTGVYASHVLEHLTLEDFSIALENTIKILKPSGLFRIIVPDLEIAAKNYLSSEAETASIDFLKSTLLGIESRPKGYGGFVRSFLGNSNHLWMWDYKSLKHELSKAGFIQIRKASFNDSRDPAFADVEHQSRFIDAVAIECMKPND